MSLEDLMVEAAEETVAAMDLGTVSKIAGDLSTANAKVKHLEEELKLAKGIREKISKTWLPEAMTELGLASLELDTGEKVSVRPFYSIQFTERDKTSGLDWLVDQGFGDIIKCTVVVQMERNQLEEAIELAQLIKAEGYESKVDRGVHFQTLTKWFKENEEMPIPGHLFNTFIGIEAKIK